MKKLWRFVFYKKSPRIVFDMETTTRELAGFSSETFSPRSLTRIVFGFFGRTSTIILKTPIPHPSPNDVFFLDKKGPQ